MFILIIKINTLYLFLVIIIKEDLKYNQFNIKNISIKFKLKEKIYLKVLKSINIKKKNIL